MNECSSVAMSVCFPLFYFKNKGAIDMQMKMALPKVDTQKRKKR